jgi:CRISPR-associated exonuclease Cas4
VQLCAQAVCLEEMLDVRLEAGALYYGEARRRVEVVFDPPLRAATRAAAERVHEIVASGRTPPAVYGGKCRACSLLELCRPKGVARSVRGYLQAIVEGP